MNVVTRKLDQSLIHPELAFARHVMRSTRDYDFDEILMRCRYLDRALGITGKQLDQLRGLEHDSGGGTKNLR